MCSNEISTMQTLKKIPGMALESETIRGSFCTDTIERPNPGFNNMEIWKDIPGYEGLYQVSNLGNVKSFKCNKEILLKLNTNNVGYYCIGLSNKNTEWFGVHRLVGMAFIPNPKNKPQINHKNNIKTDNRVENLEWCTGSYNALYGYKVGNRTAPWLGKFGAKHSRSKSVLQFDLNGKFIEEFGGMCEASRKTNTNQCSISRTCHGKQKLANKYKWKFKEY